VSDTLDVAELQPINYLSDYAQIIPDGDEPRINSMIRQYKKLTGIEIAILTVPTLGDEIDIDSYAQVMFDQWGIGEAGENNGILILISSVDELLRLQPGYGLEELLTDADSRHIEDTYMVPLFSQGKWTEGVATGIDAIKADFGNYPLTIQKEAHAMVEKQAKEQARRNLFTTLYILLGVVSLGTLIYIYRRKYVGK
jgi:uncharacterized protein